jgi:hypothetical protein
LPPTIRRSVRGGRVSVVPINTDYTRNIACS